MLVNTSLSAVPGQFIDAESAVVVPHLMLSLGEDVIYSDGYIDNWGIRTRVRLGLFGWLEIPFAFSINYSRFNSHMHRKLSTF